MSFDTEVLIIGAGMSGLGFAVQIIRNFGIRNFELIEKSEDVGGTWLANTYPGCGCDVRVLLFSILYVPACKTDTVTDSSKVASHFYSYSFALNPNWSRKYSMRPEIQAYFRSIAEQYRVVEHIRFHSIVEKAEWDDVAKVWVVTVLNLQTKERIVRRAKILVSGVGSLSVPKQCDVPGAETFRGKMFHSAQWDHSFDWKDKDVVVLGMLPTPMLIPLPLIIRRKRLLSNSIPPYYGQRTQSRAQNHSIRSPGTVPLRARKSSLLRHF
jgi:cation diffusion facilitator CzcD-associated flavoprotein CzcO